ncbi:MAG: hypothetical protein E7287_01440 [Lachnospiraceae bacterium]|nr:hypothetical protein [Lachnospiraceae bacterium]
MKKYVGINTSFGHNVLENFDEYEFRTNMSLFDYDAVILSTYFVTSNYKYETTNSYEKTPRKYQGIIVLDEDDSFNIIREFQCMKKQLQDMLEIGKNIFVILEKNEKRYIYNGEKAVSGSGKNATRTSYVQEIDENGFLPVDVKLESLLGEVTQVVAKDEYRDFYDSIRDLYLYQQIIKEPNGETDVVIPGTSNAVAMHMKYGKGNIVFIPRPYEEEEYIDDSDAKEKPLYFLKQILELDEKLNSRSQYSELPNWAKNIMLFDEKKYVEKNEAIDKKIEKLIEEKNKNSKVLNEISEYKQLLTGTGSSLENIVRKVLLELDFQLEEVEANRTDIIGKYKEISVVFEIKGLTKSAGERNAAQLEKWISEYHVETGIKPKGVLLVNAFRNKPLRERTELVFPKQMLDYSISREHCLISTVQFLCLFIECKKNKKNKDKIIKEFLNTIGVYSKYDEENMLF